MGIVCLACGYEYAAWHRASINTNLGEEWTEPECGLQVEIGALIIGPADAG